MRSLIDALASEHTLPDRELLALITMDDADAEAYLAQKAEVVRNTVYGNHVYIRGLIEFTNYCRNNCHYCGIRRSNPNCQRYRLSTGEILACCDAGYALGFRTFVLQGGEDPFFTPQTITELVRAIKGRVFDVAVDLRPGSETYGKWYGVELTEENKKQFYISEGFAHGFLVLSDTAEFCYKVTDFYHPGDEGGLAWNDPEIGVEWPIEEGMELIISEKDQKWGGLSETFRFE